MIGTRKLREQYDRTARQWLKVLRFGIRTDYGICLVRTEKVMEELDKQLSKLGE